MLNCDPEMLPFLLMLANDLQATLGMPDAAPSTEMPALPNSASTRFRLLRYTTATHSK
jgi:hypothetical protein